MNNLKKKEIAISSQNHFFDLSDIEKDYDRLDFGPQFDLNDAEDEDEFDEHEQTINFESCPDFVLSDGEGEVPLFVGQHVFHDPYLLDEDPS